MRIQFGWHLDGARWPETLDGGSCGLDDAVVGPEGLVGLLESCLGLGRPDAPHVLRVAQFLARLRAVDDGARFFSASLAADGWAVAALILGWRDALVEAGWTGENPGGGERLSTLAAVERAAGPLIPGRADRLRALLDELAALPTLPIAELRLATPAGLLPPGWRLMLDRLAAAGVRILPCKDGEALGGGDLAALGRRLAGDRTAEAVGDGGVTVLEADDEWMAAEVVAGWLAARPDLDHQVVIIKGQRTTLLDEACRRLGLPRVGGAGRSAWRGAAQVLPLAFAALWEPLDAHRLMELLTLPQSPIPSGVAEAFADALVEAPGIGGPVWQEAWRTACDRRRARLEARGLSGKELERRLAAEEREWRGWLESARFPETEGVPVPTAVALCGRVAAWARGRAAPRPGTRDGSQGGGRDEMLDTVADQAEAMAGVVAACGVSRLSRPQLDRMLDMVVADGVAMPAGGAEAAAWATVDDPGQLWGPGGTVLWWGFVDPAAAHPAIPWSNAERLALAGAGCLPEPAGARLAREAWAWRLPLLNAVDRLILVRPRRIAGEAAAAHPLWHEIEPALARCPRLSASAALTVDRLTFAGRTLFREELEPGVPPLPRARWRVPAGAVAVPDRLSATGLERLLGCPFAWVLHHVAGIRPGVLRAIPDGARLLGSLAHAVLAELLTERPDWTPEAAAARAAALFDRLLPALAAPLLRPGLGLEMERARAGVVEAARRLVGLIAEAGLRVRGCEVPVEADLDGVTLEGRVDLLLETAAGAPVVLDLKWSGSDKRRRQEIAEGRAVQLAVYGRLVGHGAGQGAGEELAVPAGYMMLAQQRLLACAPAPFPPHLHVPGSDLSAVWRAAWSGRSAALERLVDGDIRAAGIPDDSGSGSDGSAELTLEPPCKLCGYGRLCGVGSVGA
ncbi:RecB family exonuclease [Azospirillum agricola]|uniref:PD-(D/E)XK nuclease family protein n=1 Tax=Azospirillum agricola TaxID=1720247 RepID=UPI001AE30BFB|nr:PD-(D/E)XK nuclease family protein [Azospirillum agricola]MBP2230402.1 RecB family exonuclease [Azospirillum agricola]